jgi:hypothetical protein
MAREGARDGLASAIESFYKSIVQATGVGGTQAWRGEHVNRRRRERVARSRAPCHSARSAVTGFTVVARSAGM